MSNGKQSPLYILTNAIDYFFESKISIIEKILVVAFLLLYILSPLDIIPDFIPVVGWLDDIGITCAMLVFFTKRIEKVNSSSGIEVKKQNATKDNNVIDVTPIDDKTLPSSNKSPRKLPENFIKVENKD